MSGTGGQPAAAGGGTLERGGLSRIGQIAINVEDVARATHFYREVLGMRHLFDAPGLAFFDCGGVRLMLGRAERAEFDHPASVVYYRAEDIDGLRAELTRRGAEFIDEPHVIHRTAQQELWMSFLRDSEGNLLALMEERSVT
ncbi:MAG: VOC family protein [Longimicrobiales bacterium]